MVGTLTPLDEQLRVHASVLQVDHDLREAVRPRRFGVAAIPVVGDVHSPIEVEGGDALEDLTAATLALALEVQPALTGHEQAIDVPTEFARVGEGDDDAGEEIPARAQALVDEGQLLRHGFVFFGSFAFLKIWSATVVAASASMPSTTWL